MRTGTVSYKLEDLKKGVIIPIGFVGENDFTRVIFDAEEIYKKYPNASVSMKVQPPKGGIYPATVTKDGNTVIWQVKEADVANRGGGELQLTFTDGETKIKTYIARTDVKRSLAGNGPAPDPVQDWIDDAEEKLAEVDDALADLAAMDNIAKTAQASDIGKALSPKTVEDGVVTEWEYITPGGGTEDYTDLENKPSIAGVELSGNKSLADLGIAAADDLDNLADDVSDVKNAIEGVEGSVKSKAPAIYSDTEETETHTGLTNSQKVTFKGNAKAFKTARIANKANIHPTNSKTETKSGVTSVTSGRFTVVDGTSTSDSGFETVDKSITECPAGTYKFLMEIEKNESNVKAGGYLNFGIKYKNQSSYTYPVVEHVLNSKTKIETTFTAESAFNKIRFMFPITKNSIYDEYTFWIGVYPSDVVIVDTEESVPSDGEYVHNLTESMTTIDTMQHSSIVTDVVDTKNYVDSKEVDVSQKLVYISPEMFGAKGNGYADDTNALNSCISYAMNSQAYPRAAIRGYGRYKTTTGITLHGTNIDAFFHEIIYTGDDAAVTLIGSYSKFIFNRIVATEGGSNAIGIRCTTDATPVYQYDGFYCNYVECDYIISNGHTVELKYPSTASAEGIFYSVLKFRDQYSYNGNIITLDGGNIGEIDIYGKAVTAQNGYLFYGGTRFTNITHQQVRLHQYGFEGSIKNGVRGNAALIECRTRELMDKRQSNTDVGYLFDFTGVVPCSYKDGYAGDVDITAIKVTGAKSFNDVVNDAIAAAENGVSEYSVWMGFGIEGQSYAVLKNCVRAAGGQLRTQAMLPPGDIYVYYQHIAYKPHDEWYRLIDDDFTTGQAANLDFITPTVFDIDAASVDINLDYSYCCIAINEFRVIQHTGKEAVVYDKLGNKIFDGTGLGDGTFVFKCSRVPLNGFTIEYGDNQTMTAPASYVRRVYTGENEKWTITKEATIDLP